jgi:AcrR family transcriptional regulator
MAAPLLAATEPGKAEATRQSILEAAARIFRRDGYSAARLTDIAAEIGMKAGSLYYHFGSREALVEAVMETGARRTHQAVLDALATLPSDADALTRLEAAIERHLIMVLAQEDIASATIKLIWQTPAPVRERVLAEQRAYGALWRGLLEGARSAGAIRPDLDLSVTRMAIMGALNWSADWYRPGRLTPEEIAHDIAAMVIGGLAPRR